MPICTSRIFKPLAALAVASEPAQVVDILRYVTQGALDGYTGGAKR